MAGVPQCHIVHTFDYCVRRELLNETSLLVGVEVEVQCVGGGSEKQEQKKRNERGSPRKGHGVSVSWSSVVVTRKRDLAWESSSLPDLCFRFLDALTLSSGAQPPPSHLFPLLPSHLAQHAAQSVRAVRDQE